MDKIDRVGMKVYKMTKKCRKSVSKSRRIYIFLYEKIQKVEFIKVNTL